MREEVKRTHIDGTITESHLQDEEITFRSRAAPVTDSNLYLIYCTVNKYWTWIGKKL